MKVKKESEKAGLKLNIQKTKIMASSRITSWLIDGETVETVADFIFLDSKITADGDCSHEIKRCSQESQHTRPPCPSPTPGVHSDSHPSSQWCHPAISSSVIPFSSCPQCLPASESFPMSPMGMSLSKLREIVKDREAWSATINGVTNSQTRLSNWTASFLFYSLIQCFLNIL